MRRSLASAALALLSACATPSARRGPPPPSPLAKALLRTARAYLPEEEKRPAAPPLDCSDFVGKVFRAHGVKLPRTAAEMSRLGRSVASTKDLRMGDLLFFSGSSGGRSVGHVALYDNNGIFIHQPNPGEGVRLESLYSDYWRRHFLRARRIID